MWMHRGTMPQRWTGASRQQRSTKCLWTGFFGRASGSILGICLRAILVSAKELELAFRAIDYSPKPFDIVLMNTSAGSAYGTPEYIDTGCGFGREATLWLLGKGIVVVGTDAWSWDAPFSFTRQKFAKEGDASIIWEGHKAGREKAYCQIEKLANLELLPPTGFTVCCFPVKIKGGSAGFSRVVALVNEPAMK